jgi:hypothetical protein
VVGHSEYWDTTLGGVGGPMYMRLQLSYVHSSRTGQSHAAGVISGDGCRVAVILGTKP